VDLTLGQKQELLAELLPRLIDYALSLGYRIRLGEAERPEVTAKAYAAAGKGISNSLHRDRLAIDLHLFRDGRYLDKTEDHLPLVEHGENLHPLCRWGGRFGDGNHYSITHGGRR